MKHLLSPPYHPASNGLAERAVGIVKNRLKKMDVSAAPIPLHVGLQFICRVHGLTPHRSTGKCPYELFKDRKVTSLFPRLTDGEKQRCERNAVSHSVGRLRKKTTFIEGENVIIYDLKTKLSAKGKIIEVLGNNTYLADVGNGPTHISGDVISRLAASSGRSSSSDGGTRIGGHGQHGGSRAVGGGGHAHTDVGGQTQSIGGGHELADVDGQIHGGPVDSDDNIDGESDYSGSDDDDDFGEFGQWDQVRNPVRRYRRRADHLGPVVEPRLRNRRR